MDKQELAVTGREIIADMFRWGFLNEWDEDVFKLDLRSMSDDQVITAICILFDYGWITTSPYGNGYFVECEHMDLFRKAI